jgi:hypothetical protein
LEIFDSVPAQASQLLQGNSDNFGIEQYAVRHLSKKCSCHSGLTDPKRAVEKENQEAGVLSA